MTTLRLRFNIAAGDARALVAPGAMITVKGGRAHRAGKDLLLGDGDGGLTRGATGGVAADYFLLMVAMFSF